MMRYLRHLLVVCLIIILAWNCLPFLTAQADINPIPGEGGVFLINQDTIHYLTEEGCYRFTEDHLFVPCDKNCMNGAFFEEEKVINGMIAEQGRLKYDVDFRASNSKPYVTGTIEDNDIYYWDADASMPWVHFATLDRKIFDQHPRNQYTPEYAVNGNTVYVLFVHMNAGQCDLYAFDSTTGQGKRIYADQAMDRMFVLPDENKIAVSQWKSSKETNILSIDKDSLEVEKILPNEAGERWTRFFINADGTGYATDYHHLYQVKDGKATELRKITEDYGGYGCLRLCPFHEDEVLYSALLGGEKLIFTLPTYPGDDEVRPLVIVGHTNQLNQALPTIPSLTNFILQHNNLSIEYADYPSTFDEIAQAMMTKNDKFDIMLLSFTDGDLKKLYQRGYAHNLSDISALNDYFASLYPVWRDACSVDGNMFAMPLAANGSSQLMRNTALWDELSLGDVPATYDQLFDCIQRWDEQGALEEAPLFGTGVNSYQTLFWKLTFDYIAASDRQGDGLSFQNETFQHLMERLSDLRPILDAHDARGLSGDMMIFSDGRITSIKSERYNPAYPVETLEPMPMALSDSLGCAERVYLYALMVNPYSSQRKLAEEFLVYLSKNITITSQCLFIDNGMEGYERDGYQEELAKLDKNKEFYQNELEKARQAENTDLIEFWQNSVENTESAKKALPRWSISPEEVTKYQTALPHLAILQRTNYQLLYENGLSTMQQYLEGRMPLEQMCRRLDEIVRMNAMEN